MADPKKPIEEVSAEDAQALFASAAKALGGSEGRSAGFRRVSIPVSEPVRPEPLPEPLPEPEPDYEEYHARRSTPVIPSAVVFDYYEDEDDDDYEPTQEDLEEEAAFSALEAALGRHKQMYGDHSRKRGNRYHDYGFGMGISFDGLDNYDDEEE